MTNVPTTPLNNADYGRSFNYGFCRDVPLNTGDAGSDFTRIRQDIVMVKFLAHNQKMKVRVLLLHPIVSQCTAINIVYSTTVRNVRYRNIALNPSISMGLTLF